MSCRHLRWTGAVRGLAEIGSYWLLDEDAQAWGTWKLDRRAAGIWVDAAARMRCRHRKELQEAALEDSGTRRLDPTRRCWAGQSLRLAEQTLEKAKERNSWL